MDKTPSAPSPRPSPPSLRILNRVVSFLGGIGLTLPVHALSTLNGRVFGISGFLHRAVRGGQEERAAVLGFVLGGLFVGLTDGLAPKIVDANPLKVLLSGLLVGLGTKLSNGCTSGHMLCGISRLSPRSIVATATFFLTGAITTRLLHAKTLPVITDPPFVGVEEHGGRFLIYSSVATLIALIVSNVSKSASSDTEPPADKSTASDSRPSSPPSAGPKKVPAARPPAVINTSPLRRTLVSFLTSVSFAFALRLANMTDPDRVLAFLVLPPSPAFDPTLGFLALGALPLLTFLYQKYGKAYSPPSTAKIDLRLVVGAALFGVGWGIEGICPGPGLVNFGRGLVTGAGMHTMQPLALWLVAVIAGGLLVP